MLNVCNLGVSMACCHRKTKLGAYPLDYHQTCKRTHAIFESLRDFCFIKTTTISMIHTVPLINRV